MNPGEKISRRKFIGNGIKVTLGMFLAPHIPTNILAEQSNKYPEVTSIVDADEFCLDLIKNNRGLFYGETHDGWPGTQDFMLRNMKKFKDMGVTVLAMEAVDSEDQYLIDNYFNDPEKNKQQLYEYTQRKLHLFNLIEAARLVGIKVIGIDIKERDLNSPNYRKTITDEEINKWWANQVEKEMRKHSPDEKFIVYGGFLHYRPDNTGVNSFLQIPSIIPANRNELSSDFLEANKNLHGLKILPSKNDKGIYTRYYFGPF